MPDELAGYIQLEDDEDMGSRNRVSANAALGHGGPRRDREERWKQMDALAEDATQRWFELDGAFDEYRDSLSALAATYIRAHRADFKA